MGILSVGAERGVDESTKVAHVLGEGAALSEEGVNFVGEVGVVVWAEGVGNLSENSKGFAAVSKCDNRCFDVFYSDRNLRVIGAAKKLTVVPYLRICSGSGSGLHK